MLTSMPGARTPVGLLLLAVAVLFACTACDGGADSALPGSAGNPGGPGQASYFDGKGQTSAFNIPAGITGSIDAGAQRSRRARKMERSGASTGMRNFASSA